jgi:hypothetical protein
MLSIPWDQYRRTGTEFPMLNLRSLSARGVLTVLGLLAVVVSVPAQSQSAPVSTPPGWYSGDTHVHMQQCTTWNDLTLPEIDAQMAAGDLNVTAIQLWCSRWTPPDYYLSHYASMITGNEDPLSSAERRMQFGLEVSGFPASQFGHVQVLNAQTGFFPWDALYPGPILDWYRDALTGYAHVSWYESYDTVPIYGSTNGPYLAPIDAALGAIDFVETTRVEPDPALVGVTWRGLYYKLLNAGLRVSLAAGSDNSCFTQQIGDSRTYALIDSEPLTYGRWCDAIAAGRTTVSAGRGRFLDLSVDGVGIGGQVALSRPGTVSVTATLTLAPGVSESGVLHVILNGRDVATLPYSVTDGGTTTLRTPVVMADSGWLAARCEPGAHTGATFVFVADRPIVRPADVNYWLSYCDALAGELSIFNVPEVEGELLARIHSARQVYATLANFTKPMPSGAAAYGCSSPSCDGPITIGLNAPADQAFELTCLNAPPNAHGLLVLGVQADLSSSQILGCTPLVASSAPFITIPVTASPAGFASVPSPLPPGKPFRAQFVWLNQPGCSARGPVCASNGLAVAP